MAKSVTPVSDQPASRVAVPFPVITPWLSVVYAGVLGGIPQTTIAWPYAVGAGRIMSEAMTAAAKIRLMVRSLC